MGKFILRCGSCWMEKFINDSVEKAFEEQDENKLNDAKITLAVQIRERSTFSSHALKWSCQRSRKSYIV